MTDPLPPDDGYDAHQRHAERLACAECAHVYDVAHRQPQPGTWVCVDCRDRADRIAADHCGDVTNMVAAVTRPAARRRA